MAPPDPATTLLAAEAAHARAASPKTALALAAAYRRAADPEAAIALLTPLATALPNAWGVAFERGMALAMTGDMVAALAELDRAIALNPRATLARHAQRDLAGLLGRGTNVRLRFLDDPVLGEAVAALAGGAPADDRLREKFGLDSDDVAAACLIAHVAIRLECYQTAAELLQVAVARSPAYVPARLRLAEALHRAERDGAALVVIADAPLSMPFLSLRGAILLRLGREEEGLRDLRTVADEMPDDANAHLALGHALRFVGLPDEALTTYRRAIAIDANSGEAYWSIANLKTAPFTEAEMAAMAALEIHPDTLASARSHVGFALGRANEQRGDSATAFGYYATANAIRRAREPYDAAAQEAFVDRMIATCDARFFADRSGFGDPTAAPIFVVGMPRSGSTLVEQILATHSAVEGLSELPEVTRLACTVASYPEGLATMSAAEAAALGASYLERAGTRRRTPSLRFVDKFPGNAFHIALIQLMLPNATIIDVRRDARDCCVSLFAQSFAAGQVYSYDLTDLGRHYSGYRRLMRHVAAVLPGRVLQVDYEALIDDLEAQTRRMLGHCGLGFEPECLRFFANDRAVRTASSEQVRQPIYSDAIERWRRFAPWLGPLLDALDSPMETRS